MIPAKMRYKGRTFDHNPETVKVRDKAFVKEDNILFDEPLSRRTGRRCRVVSGRGQFIGDNCLNQYAELLRLYCEGGSGILSLPDIKPFFAYFTGLELSCDPTPDYIEYSFEFTEDCPENTPHTAYYHTCAQGENLWSVSYAYDVDINTLVRLNPDIRYINDNLENLRVRLC